MLARTMAGVASLGLVRTIPLTRRRFAGSISPIGGQGFSPLARACDHHSLSRAAPMRAACHQRRRGQTHRLTTGGVTLCRPIQR